MFRRDEDVSGFGVRGHERVPCPIQRVHHQRYAARARTDARHYYVLYTHGYVYLLDPRITKLSRVIFAIPSGGFPYVGLTRNMWMRGKIKQG